MADIISDFCAKSFELLVKEVEKKDSADNRIHLDMCSLLEAWTAGLVPATDSEMPPERLKRGLVEYSHRLQRMEEAVSKVLEARPAGEAPMPRTVPNGEASCTLPLWKLGFQEHCSVKGASPTTDIIDCVEKFITKGNETFLYPLIVHFQMNPPQNITPGAQIQDFSVGLVMGFAVTLACHAFAHCLWWEFRDQCYSENFWASSDSHRVLASRLHICLRLQAKYVPKESLDDLVHSGISAKKQAGLRQPPNLLQLQFAMSRLVTHLQSSGSRKSTVEILSDCIKDFQKREAVRRAKLTTNEIKGLKAVFRMSNAFQARLKVIWGGDKLNHTSVTLDLISQDFLDMTKGLSVDKATNPTWFRILTKSQPKFMEWLERTDGRFNRELDEKINTGKKINLENQAHTLRDNVQDRQLVWVMACLWVDSETETVKHNTDSRYLQYREQWRKGLLDVDLRPHAVAKDPEFRHDQLRFARPAVEESMTLGMAGDMDEKAKKAARDALMANLHNFDIQLQAEASRVQVFQASLTDWEAKSRASRRVSLSLQHDVTTQATNEEANARYQIGGFNGVQESLQFVTSAFQKVAQHPPAIGEDQVLRVNLIDLSKYGQHHSRLVEELRTLITDELREHPVTSCFVILPPHFTKFGDSMEAGSGREAAIQKARDEAFRSLTEVTTQATYKDCSWLWDRTTISEHSVRELTVKFLFLVSNQMHPNNTRKSLFLRSSLFRWGAVPTLLQAMSRSLYRNWASEVEMFGQERRCHACMFIRPIGASRCPLVSRCPRECLFRFLHSSLSYGLPQPTPLHKAWWRCCCCTYPWLACTGLPRQG